MSKPLATVNDLPSIPAGDNPFHHDLSSMGTPLVRGLVIMHPGYDREEDPQPIKWIYVVNTRTGHRVKINFDESF